MLKNKQYNLRPEKNCSKIELFFYFFNFFFGEKWLSRIIYHWHHEKMSKSRIIRNSGFGLCG